RAGTEQVRGFLDLRGGHAGDRCRPFRRAARNLRLQLLPADSVRRKEGAVDLAVAAEHMGDGEGKRRIAAGKWLEMKMRCGRGRMLHRVDDDDLGCGLADPV